jgi:hypothetical protein
LDLEEQGVQRSLARNYGVTPPSAPSNYIAPRPAPLIGPAPVPPAAVLPPSAVAARGAGAVARRGLSLLPRVAGGAALAVPIATGLAQGATDSQERVAALAGDLGVDYNSFAGRVGANLANTAQRVGNAFGAGAVYDKFSRVAAGEPFFDPYMTRPAAVAAPAPVPPAAVLPAPNTGAALIRGVENDMSGAGTTPANAPVTAMTAADVRGSSILVSGTGAIMNSRTGVVTDLDSRGEPGFGAVAEAPRYAPGTVGAYAGALMNQRQAAQTEARKLAAAKIYVEALGKGATAAHATAQANQIGLQTVAAQEYLRTHPGDYAGAATVAAGRPLPSDKFSVPIQPMGPNEPVTRLNQHTGELESVSPIRYATEANITASMAARKLTRAQVIEAYRKQGLDVSRIKP